MSARSLAVRQALTKDLNFPSYFAASSSHARAPGANLRERTSLGSRQRRSGLPEPTACNLADARRAVMLIMRQNGFLCEEAAMGMGTLSLSLPHLNFFSGGKNHKTYAFYARTDAAGRPWGPLL